MDNLFFSLEKKCKQAEVDFQNDMVVIHIKLDAKLLIKTFFLLSLFHSFFHLFLNLVFLFNML